MFFYLFQCLHFLVNTRAPEILPLRFISAETGVGRNGTVTSQRFITVSAASTWPMVIVESVGMQVFIHKIWVNVISWFPSVMIRAITLPKLLLVILHPAGLKRRNRRYGLSSL